MSAPLIKSFVEAIEKKGASPKSPPSLAKIDGGAVKSDGEALEVCAALHARLGSAGKVVEVRWLGPGREPLVTPASAAGSSAPVHSSRHAAHSNATLHL